METPRPDSSSTDTEPETLESARARGPVPLVLTVIAHPNLERVGDRSFLGVLRPGEPIRLGRREPGFAPPRRGSLRPLGDRRLSRRGLLLRAEEDDRLTIDASEWSNSLLVEGRPVADYITLESASLDRGVALLLARRVVLLLHRDEMVNDLTDGLGLVGESSGIVRVRNEIPAVAKAPFPVLIRGETGTGKELVAQAIARHPNNPRRDVSLVVRNMSTIARELAVAELFGAAEGSFTGQKGARRGAFREAHRGTLFLDEIGDTAPEVQPMLLRALESGEVVPLGQERAEKVDVRVIAATDLDLEDAVAAQRFRSPLRHRLGGYEIRVPALRRRRDDLGRLIVHFLRAMFAEVNEGPRFESRFHDFPWLPAEWVADLLAYSWPGNIRELQNVMRRWVVALVESRWNPDLGDLMLRFADLTGDKGSEHEAAAESKRVSGRTVDSNRPGDGFEEDEFEKVARQPAEIDRDELVRALDASRWTINRAAERLGIGRTSIYDLMRRHGLRTTKSLERTEIEQALDEHDSDLEAAARSLGVSRPGLVSRMSRLGLR